MKQNELYDIVEVEDIRIQKGEHNFQHLKALRNFRGNYGVPRLLNNKVIKGCFCSNKNELDNVEILVNQYIIELKKYIPVLDTEIIRESNLLYLTQQYINNDTFESLLIKRTPLNIKSNGYRDLLTQSLNVIKHSNKIIGIDGKPENWIYHENQWKYIDVFPPFLIDKNNTFSKIFNLREFEKEFANKADKSYFRNPVKIARRLWLKSEKFNNKIDYKNITLNVIKNMEFNDRTYKMVERVK